MSEDRCPNDADLKLILLYGAFGLLVMTVIGYSVLVVFFKDDIPEGLKTLFAFMVGALLGNLKEVFGFTFGSSQGSHAKDAAVAASAGALATMATAAAPAMTTTTTTETKATTDPAVSETIKQEVTEALHEAEPLKATLVDPALQPKDPSNA